MAADLPDDIGPQTAAIHAGEAVDPVTRASAPGIVMSTTFSVDRVLGFSANSAEEDMPFVYTRWGNPTTRQLEAKMAALEGAEACCAFASGMAAGMGLMASLLSAGDRLVISDTNYAGMAELARGTLTRFGIDVVPVNTADPQAVAAAMTTGTRLVWIETPANPILRLADIAAIAEIAHAGGARLAVDSTFATPVATRPLALGADYVMHSLTKYVGGHGDALGGAVCGSAEAIAALAKEAGVHYGGTISPFNAWLIMRGAATLPLRMAAHQHNAEWVARYLEHHPGVARVLYPGLPSHPQHDLARRQMRNFGGMIAFRVKGDGVAVAQRMIESLRVIHYAVSLGHHRSLVYWIATDEIARGSFGLDGRALDAYRDFAGDGVFRLSVGLEDPEDIIADLDRALSA